MTHEYGVLEAPAVSGFETLADNNGHPSRLRLDNSHGFPETTLLDYTLPLPAIAVG